MTLRAPIEAIKAYLKRIEKGEVKPDNLPPCGRCHVEALHFKIHGYRERRFLIIIHMVVQAAHCPLIRFVCPGCGKTYTLYPDFAIPRKHYTRQAIMHFAEAYAGSEATYRQSLFCENSVPGYPDGEKTLAPSTIHRWITSLSRLMNTSRKAMSMILQNTPRTAICRDLAQWVVPSGKYRTEDRRVSLHNCFRLIATQALFKIIFGFSIFTKLATSCAFT